MESSPRIVQGAQSVGSVNRLDGSTSKPNLEVEALLAEITAAEAKASKLEGGLYALQTQKVQR